MAARKKLRRQMRAFPAAPCVDAADQLRALAPSAEWPIAEENLARGLLHLGHAGKVGVSCSRSVPGGLLRPRPRLCLFPQALGCWCSDAGSACWSPVLLARGHAFTLIGGASLPLSLCSQVRSRRSSISALLPPTSRVPSGGPAAPPAQPRPAGLLRPCPHPARAVPPACACHVWRAGPAEGSAAAAAVLSGHVQPPPPPNCPRRSL